MNLATFKIRAVREDEYITAEGMILCKACNTPRILQVDTDKNGNALYLNCNCKCICDKFLQAKEEEKRREFLAKVNILKDKSDLGERYGDCTFEKSIPLPEYEPLKAYIADASMNYIKGNGMYLYGGLGRGKTQGMACMINALSEKGYLSYFTSFNNIARDIKATYRRNSTESEDEVIRFLTNEVDFLFIDDVGTEYISGDGSQFIKEIIFDIINKRYNQLAPTIYSSNLSPKQLMTANIDERVIHRIIESTKRVEFTGKNMRSGQRLS